MPPVIIVFICFVVLIFIPLITVSFVKAYKHNMAAINEKEEQEKRKNEKQIYTDDYEGKELVINPNVAEIKELNKKCPSCHLEIIPGRDKHCPHCGASLTNICPHCHLINHENAFLCQECYTKLPYATKKNKNKKKDEDEPLEF